MIEAPPPHDAESERCVLGSILVDNESFDVVAQILKPRHFYAMFNRRIYETMAAMYERSQGGIDGVTLRVELETRGLLDECGGTPYVLQLLQTVPFAWHADYYAKIVRSLADKRDALQVATRIQRGIADGEELSAVLSAAENALFRIAAGESDGGSHIGDVLEPTFEAIMDRMDNPDGVRGIPTGLSGLDELIGGLQASRLIVLAARPGMGKTALACHLGLACARRAARDAEQAPNDGRGPRHAPGGALVVTLEMPKTEIAERFLSMQGRVDGRNLSRGKLDTIDQHNLVTGADALRGMPIFMEGGSGMTMMQLEGVCRRHRRVNEIGLVIVDHLGLVQKEDPRTPDEAHVSMVSRRLKMLANALEVPVLALCQLNRELEKREDKRPRLSDLRSSGAIEQDADAVMFLHRPEVYDSTCRQNEADLTVLKNRSGETGAAPLVWRPQFMQFADKAIEIDGVF